MIDNFKVNDKISFVLNGVPVEQPIPEQIQPEEAESVERQTDQKE